MSCTESTTAPQQADPPQGQGQGKGKGQGHGRCVRPSLRPLGAAVDRLLLAVFGSIARAVATHPVLTMVLSICAGLVMASGLVFLEPVDDFNALYNPAHTQASTDMVRPRVYQTSVPKGYLVLYSVPDSCSM